MERSRVSAYAVYLATETFDLIFFSLVTTAAALYVRTIRHHGRDVIG